MSSSHRWPIFGWWSLVRWTRITARHNLSPTEADVSAWTEAHRRLISTYVSLQGSAPRSPTWILPTATAAITLIGLDQLVDWYRAAPPTVAMGAVIGLGMVYLALMLGVAVFAESRRSFWHWCLQRSLEVAALQEDAAVEIPRPRRRRSLRFRWSSSAR